MGLKLTIRKAVVIAVLLGVLLPALGVGIYLTRNYYVDKLDREIIQALQRDSDVLSLGVRESLWAIDNESTSALVEAVMKDSPLVSVEVLDPELGRFVFRENPERRLGKIYKLERSVLHRGEVIGRVRLEISDAAFTSEFQRQMISQGEALALQLLCSVLLILAVLQVRVGRPLKRLTTEAISLAKGELSASIQPLRQDEIGEVEAQLEVTRQALQNLFQTLEQKNQALENDLQERMRVESTLRDREQRLRTLVDQSPLAVIEFDLDWTIQNWNEAACNTFLWDRNSALNKPISILQTTPRNPLKDRNDDLAKNGTGQERQYNKRADGQTIICQWYYSTIRDAEGTPLRIVAMVEDITEQQQADDEIRRLATVVRMTTNLVTLVDALGNVIWFNRAFGERCVPPGASPLGRPLIGLLQGQTSPQDRSRYTIIDQVFTSGTSQSINELLCISATQTPYWVSMELQPMRNDQGSLQQWVVVMTDVTDRHIIADALRNIARIEASNDTRLFLTQILAVIARGTGASGAYIALNQDDNIEVCTTWGRSATEIATGLHPKTHSIARHIELAGAQRIVDNIKGYLQEDAILKNAVNCKALIAEPLLDPHQEIMGHLALLFDVVPNSPEEIQSLAEIGASRAGAELSRQRTLEALQHSEQRFSSIFQSSPIPLALFRCTDKHCLDLNPAFRLAFGNLEMVQDAGGAAYQTWLATVLGGTQDSASADLRLLTARGEQRDCQLIARRVTINEEDSQLIAIVDVTQLLEAQRQIKELNLSLEQRVQERTQDLAQANQNLEHTLEQLRRTLDELVRSEKLAALGSLVAGIAHELNTPIGNSLIVASTLRDMNKEFRTQMQSGLRKSTLDGYVNENDSAADILVRNLHRAAELITSFKQVAVDQTSSQRRTFNLAEVINEIIVTMHPVFRKTNFSIDTRIPADLQLDSYPGPLGQVLANLLNNALLHAFEGRNDGSILLRAECPDAEHVSLLCQDNGIGISPANLKRIFDPFFTTKLGQDGTGLGLNIVHNIVTGILGGSIKVNSTEGVGTGFTITLPLKAPGK
ncbi:PAS domain S-box protein [Uliginosibacterium gangwonense]|uniref:PAS domain S-box protein n=1 Tax=Uliginosibacterium gangwonense TaxID=392736 RepID=UPI00038103DF|nr:PAS domain S-box protein [Uliginosibacterium gangwonense]